MKNQRRSFLRNISLGVAGIGLLRPSVSAAPSRSKAPLRDCPETTLDFYGQGPFYTPNPPARSDGMLAESTEPGQRMIISGRVHDLECDDFIPNTLIDVWHAYDAGAYDNVGFNLRGTVMTNNQGFYVFETVKPGKYLNGAQFRPSHIHYKITPPNFPTLTTQLYFEGDTSIPDDAAASITTGIYDASNRIIPLVENMDGKLEGVWDIYIDGDGISSARDLHLDKGMVYTASPNPFRDELHIRYGVFQKSMVGLKVFDMQGRLVADLEEEQRPPNKYDVSWQPPTDLPNGHYFIVLQMNGLQVHYQKVVLSR